MPRTTADRLRALAALAAVVAVLVSGCSPDQTGDPDETDETSSAEPSPDTTSADLSPTTDPGTTEQEPEADLGPLGGTSAATDPATVAAANRFLDTYLDPDGRVVRHDNGGDTVSEGQAYAMLAAVGIGDHDRFDLAWRWAESNLARDDGLWSWHWADGTVTDPQPAPDADLDAAWALLVASERFDQSDYHAHALAMATAVLDHSTVSTDAGPVLVAGPWAVTDRTVNPSYFSPLTYQLLADATGDTSWDQLDSTSHRVLAELTSSAPHLAPDWAILDADDSATPRDTPPLFGWDASRTLLRYAISCDADDRALAARAWTAHFDEVTVGGSTQPMAVYNLSGDPTETYPHASMTASVAASAAAVGEEQAARRLLDQADAHERDHPSYYGASLAAIARIAITTDALGACGLASTSP